MVLGKLDPEGKETLLEDFRFKQYDSNINNLDSRIDILEESRNSQPTLPSFKLTHENVSQLS